MSRKFTLLGTALAAALSFGAIGNASAHAISIGYENAGAGAVTVWLGTYSSGHAGPINEGSLKLEGISTLFGPVTTAFNLLTCTGALACKPTGLIDGTTNFYIPNISDPNAALVNDESGFNASCPACGPVDHWQGVTFAGLAAGTYQFTWVPAASPTAQWDIINNNMNGVFDLSGVINPGVPEPGSLALVGLAMFGLAAAQRRRSTKV